MNTFRIIFLLLAAQSISVRSDAQRYSNYFTEQLGPIDWQAISDSVAPNLPPYLLSHAEENDAYKKVVVTWIYDHPEEFNKAKMIDFRLHAYVDWAINPNGLKKGEGAYGNPAFMYYPVNENRPVFIDMQNPDQDSLIYRYKLQHWYLKYDRDSYESLYGPVQNMVPYPRPINDPSEFPVEYARSNYEGYYPEFSKDTAVFGQYLKLYRAQYSATEQQNEQR